MPPELPRSGSSAASVKAFCYSVLPLVVGVLVFAASYFAAGAEAGRMVATIGHPATVAVADRGEAKGRGGSRIVATIVAFTPASDGSAVEIVVRTRRGYCGAGREIGRFSIFPNRAFSPSDRGKAKSFGMELPLDAVVRDPLTVTVSVEAVRGRGTGARLEMGGVEIE